MRIKLETFSYEMGTQPSACRAGTRCTNQDKFFIGGELIAQASKEVPSGLERVRYHMSCLSHFVASLEDAHVESDNLSILKVIEVIEKK